MKRVVVTYLALLALVGADECADGGRCKDGQTCCNDPANGSECCLFAEAVCCEDHRHCCPVGTTCHKATSSCVNGTTSTPWVESNSADQPRLSKSFRMIKTNMGEEDDNICPDQSRCPPEFSCLKALTRFGCCPLTQGVSCSDGKHCCPDGHQCSADSRSCIKKELVTTILCGDKASECPEETTCCENSVGTWGCCPMPMAVCCEDKIHCCSEGSVCETEHSKCISLSTKKELPMWAKLPARIRADWEIQKEVQQVKAETVDDGGSEKVPEVTTIVNTLFSTGAVHEELRKEQSEEENKEVVGMVQCDVHYNCPQNNTCCFINSSQTWSCCPVLEALCCSDGVHCCPNGYQCCDGTCTKGDKVIPWYNKLPANASIQTSTTTVHCADGCQCPDGNTCCKLVTGDFGCCPLPNALCCSDGVHCCPHGYQCHNGSCTKGDEVIPWYTKLPANASIQTNPTTVQCDAMSQCPDGNSCCKLVTGDWACCPLPKALCCSDGVHCCPNGYQCHDGTCTKGDKVIPGYNKLPAITSIQTSTTTVHCADGSQCPDGNTCCKLVTGEFGCCPLPNAVCCRDRQHCCPQGYTCNVTSNSCQRHIMLQLNAFPLMPVDLPVIQLQLRETQCDENTKCIEGDTCCLISTTAWGCCPYPDAVCCSDMKHCCPANYICAEGKECKKKRLWFNWHMHITSKKTSVIL